MRSITITICIFTNLIILGMCGYFYLLLSQYWSYWNKHNEYILNSKKSVYDKEIYYYNHGYPNETNNNDNNIQFAFFQNLKHTTIKQNILDLITTHKRRNSRQVTTIKHNDTVLIITDSKPRFVNLQNAIIELDTNKYNCHSRDDVNCTEKTLDYKNKLSMELQRILMKDGDAFNTRNKLNNPYNVNYVGKRENFMKKSSTQLLCEMKNSVRVKTITRYDAPFDRADMSKYFPKRTMFYNKHFNTCAIIASAGSLLNSNLGSFIDEHDLVLRFNHAPTKGYERDVGSKTTVRILNSQVVTKPEFHFVTSHLYRINLTQILIWDPCNYTTQMLDEWSKRPEHPFFPNFKKFRNSVMSEMITSTTNNNINGTSASSGSSASSASASKRATKVYVLDPRSLWSIWNFLQSNSLSRLRKNPPSSGFLALAHLLNFCSYVDIFEYLPSVRVTRKCHYFDSEDNPACTFGAWHPLAGEKLIAYAMNIADDYEVFQRGYIRIPGYKLVQC